jgi:DNA modification methylase
MIVGDLAALAQPIDRLRPMPGNPRRGNVDAVARSLSRFGQRKPIVAHADGTVLAGNHTLAAALQLGWPEIAVVFVEDDEPTAKAFALADNRTAELGGYDDDDLAAMMQSVAEYDVDLLLDTSWNPEDLAALLAPKVVELPPTADELPDAARVQRVTEPGDMWLLGPHRLICGDATDVGVYDRLLDGDDAKAFGFTSPPYNAGQEIGTARPDNRNKYREGYNDDRPENEWADLVTASANAMLLHCEYAVMNIQMLSGNKRAFLRLLGEWSGRVADIAVWSKTNVQPAMAQKVMNSAFEFLIILADKENPTRAITSADFRGTVSNVHTASSASRQEYAREHSATFPAHLPAWAIENFTRPNQTVVDCFAGTGTTLIAAHTYGRRARLIEIDARYCDIICARYQRETNDRPVLVATGEARDFTEI